MLQTPPSSSRITRFAWGVLAANIAVVLWGAVVRATGSGAGCGRHWPRCNGQVLPELASAKTLVEFTHRITSGLAFVLVAALLVMVLRRFPGRHPARLGAGLAMLFMVMEALAGAGLVWFELVAENRSAFRAVSMAVHLTITFLLLGSIALTAWWAAGNPPLRVRGGAAWVAGTAALIVLLVGITGSMTALGDTLFPKQSIGLEAGDSIHFLQRLRVVHPVLAVLGGAVAALAARLLARMRGDRRTRVLARAVAAAYAVQVAAGVLNMVLLVPLWMQLVHLALADALWILLVLTAASALAGQAAPAAHATNRPALAEHP